MQPTDISKRVFHVVVKDTLFWYKEYMLFFYLGLLTHRYGNWNDVSRFVDTKGPNECRDAVNNFFVDGKDSFLNMCLNNCTTKD
jgi:hypothetical protein